MDRRTFIAACIASSAAPAAFAGGHGRLFSFKGINGHTVTGTAEIAGNTVNLLADFVFDGAPDPKIALGNDGTFDPATLSGDLKSDAGASSYELPAGVNPDNYNEVWVWCEQFSVGLAVASAS